MICLKLTVWGTLRGRWQVCLRQHFLIFFFFFLFLVVLRFDLRASCFLMKALYHLSHFTSPVFLFMSLQTIMIYVTRYVYYKSGYSCWAPVAHTYNPRYSRGRGQEDHNLKPAWENSSRNPILKIPNTKNGLAEYHHTHTHTHTHTRTTVHCKLAWFKEYPPLLFFNLKIERLTKVVELLNLAPVHSQL
jgi:hypothetical protein